MTKNLQVLGYVRGAFAAPADLWPGTLAVRGHGVPLLPGRCDADARFAIRLGQGFGIHEGNDGLVEHAAIGAYPHAYFTDAF